MTGRPLGAESAPPPRPYVPVAEYPQGVLSAEPTENSVMVWTRVLPALDSGLGVDVLVEIARDPSFAASSVLAARTLRANSSSDHTVMTDLDGLPSGSTLWYRFICRGAISPVGRTRTAPSQLLDAAPVRIAAFSCQRYTHGYFTSHADLAALALNPSTDVDVVLSLGDYVYETGYADGVTVAGRDDPLQNALSQDDFRFKYRLYRSDPDLQAVHAAYPVVGIFDNHDGLSGPGDAQGPGALAAFFEYWPIRCGVPGQQYRSFRWGRQAEIWMTDQRQYRTPTPEESGSQLGTCTWAQPDAQDPKATMLGRQQADWLLDGLVGSSANWRVVGSQLMFWPWRTIGRLPFEPRGAGCYLNFTQWDGYQAERFRILDTLEQTRTTNTVVLSGDSHIFSAASVSPDWDDVNRAPVVAEFNAGSITSANADENGIPTSEITGPLLSSLDPYLNWFNSERHGYVVMELTDSAATAEFRSPRTIRESRSGVDVLGRFGIPSGTQHIDVLSTPG